MAVASSLVWVAGRLWSAVAARGISQRIYLWGESRVRSLIQELGSLCGCLENSWTIHVWVMDGLGGVAIIC